MKKIISLSDSATANAIVSLVQNGSQCCRQVATLYIDVRKMWQLHVQPIDPHARVRTEAFKYVGNLGRERYDASSYRASAVAASKPISARGY